MTEFYYHKMNRFIIQRKSSCFLEQLLLIFLISILLTGCGKIDTNNLETVCITDEIDEQEIVEDDGEDTMSTTSFTEEEKNMMAGKQQISDANEENLTVSKDIGSEEDIIIFPDMRLNNRNDNNEYGELTHVTYYSNTCKKERGMNIQLPANYSEEKSYPVLYVLHGIFGDEYSMCGDGKTGIPVLIDNLISEGSAKEMITVYPFMYASSTQDQCTAIDDENVAAYDNFINELVDDIMPYIKENYSILEGKENTAVTGFSMGGRESLAIGIYRPDLFGYVGSIAPAPGLVPGSDIHLNHPGQFSEDEITYTEEKPYLIMICAGDKDSVVGTFPKSYDKLYTENGIDHIWWEVPGSDHGDPAITSGIYNFLKKIFIEE